MKYSAEYKNIYVEFIEDDDFNNFGCSNFTYNGNKITVLCEGHSLYDIIQDFIKMIDEIIKIVDNDRRKEN